VSYQSWGRSCFSALGIETEGFSNITAR
jgi:hypothetical protein